jgi:hypothetical protein
MPLIKEHRGLLPDREADHTSCGHETENKWCHTSTPFLHGVILTKV